MFGAVIGSLLSVLAVAPSNAPMSYAEALKHSQETGKPLLVVVGSDACPACVTLKNQTIEPMTREGGLEDVSFVVVNRDAEPELAGRLMKGNRIPQVILYSQSESGWLRRQLTGFQSKAGIRTLIKNAVQKVKALN